MDRREMGMWAASQACDAVLAFFLEPVSALPAGLCRMFLGAVMLYDGVERMRRSSARGSRVFPQNELARIGGVPHSVSRALQVVSGALPSAHVTLCVAFSVGLCTKLSGALLLCTLTLTQLTNPFVLYAGDGFARLMLLLLVFSPSDVALSVDAYIQGGTAALSRAAPPWGMRLIQLELSMLYLNNFFHKLRWPEWRDGRAVLWVLNNADFARARIPAMLRRPEPARWMTHGTLLFEAIIAPALWLGLTRPYAWGAALVFHAGIAWLIDVHLFSPIMMAALASFTPIASGSPVRFIGGASELSWAELTGVCCALSYFAYRLASYWPASTQRPAARELLVPGRACALFAPPGDEELELEIVAVDSTGRAQAYHWDLPRGLRRGPRCRTWAPGHRLKRFEFSIFKHEQLRAAFARAVREQLREDPGGLRAMVIDALIWRIEIPGVRPRELVESVNLHLELDAHAAVPDVGAISALAQAVRSDQALARLLGFLVRISNTSEAGCAQQQALEAIEAMLANSQGQCRCAAAVRAAR